MSERGRLHYVFLQDTDHTIFQNLDPRRPTAEVHKFNLILALHWHPNLFSGLLYFNANVFALLKVQFENG